MGKHCRRNQEALKWYRKAAPRVGHREAEIRLAEVYERGDGITRDYVKASRMYAKAAEQGDSKSEIRLDDCT